MVPTVTGNSTAEQLLYALEERNVGPCLECATFRIRYAERIRTTRSKEALFHASEENSDDEAKFSRQVSQAVRLEATTARRFLLHFLNHPVGVR